MTIGRRAFAGYSAASVLALAFAKPRELVSAERSVPNFHEDPFALGIASGDPLPDSVVLWTRLAPDPLDPHGGVGAYVVPVDWQVALDEGFRRVVRQGTHRARPEFVHSVHVDVQGLHPGTEYFYRFRAGGKLSPVGRTRTAPAAGTTPARFRFAMVCCQAWFDGYYTAYEHLAEEDLDLVLHVGDYIYEFGVQTNGGRGDSSLPDEFYRQTIWLNEYRNRYALYKLDPHLQAAHRIAPWVLTWDDHEVVDNYADENYSSVAPHDFLIRRANAYRAYWEHQPLRPPQPNGPDLVLYRRFDFGDLLRFDVLDTRQYRDDQACGDGLRTNCAERLDPARTVLGDAQEKWLLDGLGSSPARWNFVAQQIMLSQVDFTTAPGQSFSMDMWDGYKPARDRLLQGIVDRKVSNPVVLSGDFHRSMVADVKSDFDNPDSATIATEFLGTSISSGMDGADMDEYGREFLPANPHLKFYNGQRGYLKLDVKPDTLQADYRVVPYVRQPGAPVSTRASFVVENGKPGVEAAGSNKPLGKAYAENVEPPEPLMNWDETIQGGLR